MTFQDHAATRMHEMFKPYEAVHPGITIKFDNFRASLLKALSVQCLPAGDWQVHLHYNNRNVGEIDFQSGFKIRPGFYLTAALTQVRKTNDASELRRYKSYHLTLAHIAGIKSNITIDLSNPKDGGNSNAIPFTKLLDHREEAIDAIRAYIEPRGALAPAC